MSQPASFNSPGLDRTLDDSSSPSRHSKRQKRQHEALTLRTAIACRACRQRKTRCSGHQPTCGYCSKAGIPCEYTSSSVAQPLSAPSSQDPLDEWGNRILSAVAGLAQDLQRHGSSSYTGIGSRPAPRIRRRAIASADHGSDDTASEESSVAIENYGRSHSHPQTKRIALHGPTLTTGCQGILSWPTFSTTSHTLLTRQLLDARLTCAQQHNADRYASESASCAAPALNGLLSHFTEWLLPSMPIVDPGQVRQMISMMGEYGVPWTGEACLVLLIAALSLVYQHAPARDDISLGTPSEASASASSRQATSNVAADERITASARRYWTMARKRLSWATNATGLLPAQCQLLASVYLMHSSEPVAAWKMLTGALLSLEGDSLADQTNLATESLFRQQVQRTAASLLCRLRYEIELAVVPPFLELNLDPCVPDQHTDEERFALVYNHLDTDILRIKTDSIALSSLVKPGLSIKDIHHLLDKMDSLLAALDLWHENLASSLQGSRGANPLSPEPSVHNVLLDRRLAQHMYHEAEELILRPSLFLLLHAESLKGFISASQSGTNAMQHKFENVRGSYVVDQLQRMVARHRSVLLTRVRICLHPPGGKPIWPEIGWLRRRTAFMLGVLLSATVRPQLSRIGTGHEVAKDALTQIIAFLSADNLCREESTVAIEILQQWQ